jgi:type II secretory pathway component PulF
VKKPKNSVKSLTAKPAFSELSDTVRAQLFTQFNTLERSGIPLLQALPIISGQSPASIKEKLKSLTQWIQKGTSLADAGRRSGVFLSWEARLIGAAEAAGSLQTVFTQLSEHYQARASRLRKLKVRLVYPYAVLIIGILVLPLPLLSPHRPRVRPLARWRYDRRRRDHSAPEPRGCDAITQTNRSRD